MCLFYIAVLLLKEGKKVVFEMSAFVFHDELIILLFQMF